MLGTELPRGGQCLAKVQLPDGTIDAQDLQGKVSHGGRIEI